MLAASLALALVLHAVPGDDDEDILLVDKPELTKMELDAALYDRHVTTKLPSAPAITLTRGDTVFVELEVPLQRAPAGPVEVKVIDYRTSASAKLAPTPELVELTTRGGRSAARVLVPVRAAPSAPLEPQKLSATIEVRDGDGPPLGVRALQSTVELVAPSPSAEKVDLDRRAFLYHQSAAIQIYRMLPALHAHLRLDRVDPRPPRSAVPDAARALLDRFCAHRLRADVALSRLVAATDAADPMLAEAALLAIGSLSKRPTGPARRATIIDGEKNTRALELATKALDELRIDDAEGILDRLRSGGKLEKAELARALVLLGAIYVVRGRDADGRRELGRALCVEPKSTLGLTRAALVALAGRALAKEQSASCKTPLIVGVITAERVPGEDGPELLVRAEIGPDPRQLATGGDLELWGGGGARTRAEKIRVSHEGGAHLEARFPDSGDLETFAGQVLVKVYVRELSGVVLASAGDRDPVAINVTTSDALSSFPVPWWVVAIAAGVAAAGTITTVVVLRENRDVQRGIGPVTLEF